MKHALFVYGTLQIPEVLKKIIGRTVSGEPAILSGYQSGLVYKANFPGIVADSNSKVEGQWLVGFSQQELRWMDRYEGELYLRARVTVSLSNGLKKTCWVYRIAPWAESRVTAHSWSISWYRDQGHKGRLTYRS